MPKPKFPKSVGAAVDFAYQLREARLEAQRDMEAQIAKMKKAEQELEDHILRSFDKAEIEGARGSLCTASISRITIPTVKDWPTVFGYIAKHDAWDLLERRMARVAYRDRLEAGEVVPGTEPFVKVSLYLTKIGK